MSVTATLVIDFAPGDAGAGSAILTAEIDSYPASQGGLNDGKTSFTTGDNPGYLVFKSDGVSITQHTSSIGVIQELGARVITITEFINFANTNEASLSRPASSVPSVQWLGRSLKSPKLGSLGTSIVCAEAGVAVAQVTYSTIALQFRLTQVPATVGGLSSFQALIYIQGS